MCGRFTLRRDLHERRAQWLIIVGTQRFRRTGLFKYCLRLDRTVTLLIFRIQSGIFKGVMRIFSPWGAPHVFIPIGCLCAIWLWLSGDRRPAAVMFIAVLLTLHTGIVTALQLVGCARTFSGWPPPMQWPIGCAGPRRVVHEHYSNTRFTTEPRCQALSGWRARPEPM
jgi:hypothetical protein